MASGFNSLKLNSARINGGVATGFLVAQIESAAATDTPSATRQLAASTTEPVSASNTQSVVVAYQLSKTEPVSATDTPSASINMRAGNTVAASGGLINGNRVLFGVINGRWFNAYNALMSEVTSASDSLTVASIFNLSLAESVSATDTPSATLQGVATQTESTAAFESPSASVSTRAGNTVVESSGLINGSRVLFGVINGRGYATLMSEAHSASDSSTEASVYNLSIAESVSATDTPSAALQLAASNTGDRSGTINGNHIQFGVINGVGYRSETSLVLESAFASESPTVAVSYALAVSETATASESPTVAVSYGLAVSETATAADTAFCSTHGDISEAAAATDSYTTTETHAVQAHVVSGLVVVHTGDSAVAPHPSYGGLSAHGAYSGLGSHTFYGTYTEHGGWAALTSHVDEGDLMEHTGSDSLIPHLATIAVNSHSAGTSVTRH